MGNNQITPPYMSYPAAYNSWVIAVGALLKVNHGDTLYARPDMNYNSFIDVTAPGDSLRTTQWKTTDPNNHKRYGWFGMTSASTPVVSGVTALVRSRFPNKSNTEVMDIIRDSAVLFNGWENDFNHYGHGMVNAFYAVAPPVAPQNLTASPNPGPGYQYFVAQLSWTKNSEPDISRYEIYRKITNYGEVYQNWTYIGYTANTFYNDYDMPFTLGGNYTLYYKIKAKDTAGQLSPYSNTDTIENVTIIPKESSPGDSTSVLAPLTFELKNNYPNPFNASTIIQFSIPEDSKVELSIYDINGKEVTTLVNDWRAKGNHFVHYIADELPSGIYFYRLKAGHFTSVKRMLLIK